MEKTERLSLTIVIPMCILAILRIGLGVMLGIWYPAAQFWDDQLMVSYMDIAEHFNSPLYYSLVKDMGWPVLVSVFSHTGLPYAVLTGILWDAAAFSVLYLFKRLFKGNKAIMMAGYVYVLFMPQAFDVWSGTRFYRNSAIAPFVIISLVFVIVL